MQHAPIGELLKRVAGLNGLDVDEILHEQDATRKRFGEIALSWGLCQPEHIWEAWSHQLRGDRRQHVCLSETGVDAQAVAQLPETLARRFQVIPIRHYEQRLIAAVSEESAERARAEMPALLGRRIDFVLADAGEIERALDEYYPTLPLSGGQPERPCVAACCPDPLVVQDP